MTFPRLNRHPELVSGSIPRFARSKGRKSQPHGKVAPLGVLAIDQIDLPWPKPALELPCENVDARLAFIPHDPFCAARWTLKQVQGDDAFGWEAPK